MLRWGGARNVASFPPQHTSRRRTATHPLGLWTNLRNYFAYANNFLQLRRYCYTQSLWFSISRLVTSLLWYCSVLWPVLQFTLLIF